MTKLSPFLWLILLVILLLMPGDPNAHYRLFIHEDKLVHFGLFFVLSLLWIKYLGEKQIIPKYLIVVFFGAVLAFTTEYIQQFIPHRSQSNWDVFANLAGTFLALAFCYLQEKKEFFFLQKS